MTGLSLIGEKMKHYPKTVVIDWLNTIWETDLPYQSKYLACYLRKFMNSQHDMAWPSYSRIVQETGLSKSTIARYFKVLEDDQWIIRDTGHIGKNTRYTACFPTSVTQTLVSQGDLTSVTQTPTSVTETHELNKELNNELNNIKQSAIDSEFEQVWILYGKKGNKKTSKAKYTKLSQVKKDLLSNHIPNYVFSTPDKQYRKNFETYLNQEVWNDEIITTSQPAQPANSFDLLTDRSWAKDLVEGNTIEHQN